jgi:hypothetical protein
MKPPASIKLSFHPGRPAYLGLTQPVGRAG